ncbi:MAG: hypothetical protein ACI9QC_000397 [Oceanicoccus sp.]|jgi:hypothetical protein
MEAAKRPTLYTVLGVLAVLGLISSVMGILVIGGAIAVLGAEAPMLMLIVSGIVLAVAGALNLAEVVGFFKMKKFMPNVVVAAFGLGLVSMVLTYMASPETFSMGGQAVSLIISGAIVWKVNEDKAMFKN